MDRILAETELLSLSLTRLRVRFKSSKVILLFFKDDSKWTRAGADSEVICSNNTRANGGIGCSNHHTLSLNCAPQAFLTHFVRTLVMLSVPTMYVPRVL